MPDSRLANVWRPGSGDRPAGQQHQPGWYYNLRADPVTVDTRTSRFRAVEAEVDVRRRIWEEGLRVYPGWAPRRRRQAPPTIVH